MSAKFSDPRFARICHWALAALITLGLAAAITDVAVDTMAFRLAAAAPLGREVVRPRSEHPPVLWMAPEFSLVDQNGELISKSTLSKHVWIANFIFTRCTSVCPTSTAKMRSLQRRFQSPDLRFVSFSVDPEHDTQSVLRSYSEAWGKPETRWSLLHTEAESLQRLSDGMRVVARATGDDANAVMHTSLFFLVDSLGRVRGQYDSNDERALQELRADTMALATEHSPLEQPPQQRDSGKLHFDALGCAGCHDDPRIAPALSGLWGQSVSLADGTRARFDESYVRQSLSAPGRQLVSGYLDLMPSYIDDLSDKQLDSVVDYVRSLSRVAPDDSVPMPVALADARPASANALAGDPVCGMKVHVTPETPRATRDGQAYYFCSEPCRARFLAGTAEAHQHAH